MLTICFFTTYETMMNVWRWWMEVHMTLSTFVVRHHMNRQAVDHCASADLIRWIVRNLFRSEYFLVGF